MLICRVRQQPVRKQDARRDIDRHASDGRPRLGFFIACAVQPRHLAARLPTGCPRIGRTTRGARAFQFRHAKPPRRRLSRRSRHRGSRAAVRPRLRVRPRAARGLREGGLAPAAAPGRGWSKRNRQDRIDRSDALRRCARQMRVDVQQIDSAMSDGFGMSDIGEDQFDSVVGLLGMLAVVLRVRSDGAPHDEAVRSTEGWILGQNSNAVSWAS